MLGVLYVLHALHITKYQKNQFQNNYVLYGVIILLPSWVVKKNINKNRCIVTPRMPPQAAQILKTTLISEEFIYPWKLLIFLCSRSITVKKSLDRNQIWPWFVFSSKQPGYEISALHNYASLQTLRRISFFFKVQEA